MKLKGIPVFLSNYGGTIYSTYTYGYQGEENMCIQIWRKQLITFIRQGERGWFAISIKDALAGKV